MSDTVSRTTRRSARNLSTALSGRRSQNPMREFDALPPELRRWLAQAALPWSARSVRKIWRKGLQEGGVPAALARLSAAEVATLSKEKLAR
ncbi:DUF6525 family protein [Shimia thalassica]|uniref:DUF6525 family protein n=1 Tax=Shimia thalassica TaxID=1715693 RepID=UPI002735EAD8|nr:DUF6525 family protein [Shimia thalassica]MDP2580993.1 DUF6525 family protein [Shimia thalassica]